MNSKSADQIQHSLLALLIAWSCLVTAPSWAQMESSSAAVSSSADETAASSSEISQSSAPAIPTTAEQQQALLAAAMGDQSQWLDTTHGKILTFYRPTETQSTKGALLLLHAAEDPQAWPPELETLRQQLPKYGWETLAVSLPQKTPPTVPARPNSVSSSSSDATDQTSSEISSQPSSPEPSPEPNPESSQTSSSEASNQASSPSLSREELIKAYLLAALSFLNEKGQYNLVVLTDNSSLYWSMQLLSPKIKTNNLDPSTVDGPLQALVVINLQPQEPLSKTELETSFNQAQLPVLDLFFAPESEEQQTERELHKACAMRNKLSAYQQLLIEPLPQAVEGNNNYLLQRIRGFMDKNAQGKEIKTK